MQYPFITKHITFLELELLNSNGKLLITKKNVFINNCLSFIIADNIHCFDQLIIYHLFLLIYKFNLRKDYKIKGCNMVGSLIFSNGDNLIWLNTKKKYGVYGEEERLVDRIYPFQPLWKGCCRTLIRSISLLSPPLILLRLPPSTKLCWTCAKITVTAPKVEAFGFSQSAQKLVVLFLFQTSELVSCRSR